MIDLELLFAIVFFGAWSIGIAYLTCLILAWQLRHVRMLLGYQPSPILTPRQWLLVRLVFTLGYSLLSWGIFFFGIVGYRLPG